MKAETIIATIAHELRKHSLDTFVDNPPAVADGGNGILVTGCPACRARLFTTSQFVEHLIQVAIPRAVLALKETGK